MKKIVVCFILIFVTFGCTPKVNVSGFDAIDRDATLDSQFKQAEKQIEKLTGQAEEISSENTPIFFKLDAIDEILNDSETAKKNISKHQEITHEYQGAELKSGDYYKMKSKECELEQTKIADTLTQSIFANNSYDENVSKSWGEYEVSKKIYDTMIEALEKDDKDLYQKALDLCEENKKYLEESDPKLYKKYLDRKEIKEEKQRYQDKAQEIKEVLNESREK
ncbi:MAG: hypothetical protein KHX08_03960 [Clostridiales bacterium]|nr:hypothetical protein [Clostridiales bacterium]